MTLAEISVLCTDGKQNNEVFNESIAEWVSLTPHEQLERARRGR